MQVNRAGNGTIAVKLGGSLDRETVPDIRKQVLKVSRKKDTGDLTVDLSRVAAIDTAGLALLIEVFVNLCGRGRALRLEGANERVERMIRLADLDRLFEAQYLSIHGK
jgi:anti-anti-sigma factor